MPRASGKREGGSAGWLNRVGEFVPEGGAVIQEAKGGERLMAMTHTGR